MGDDVDQVTFDEETAASLERVYRTRDIRRRRALVLDALDPQPGESVLDLGCGPGFYVPEILDRVGDEGAVTAVDLSPAMLAMTRKRLDGRAGAVLAEGSATSIPAEAASQDRVVSVQVMEYVPDIDAALAEIRRVLKPAGRLVVWDIDWSTLSWHALDEARMERMTAAWDRHLVHPALPRTLAASLARAGFSDVRREGHVFACTSMDPEAFGGYIPSMIRKYLAGLADVPRDEATAWLDELQQLDAEGRYSFAVVQFCFTATRGD